MDFTTPPRRTMAQCMAERQVQLDILGDTLQDVDASYPWWHRMLFRNRMRLSADQAIRYARASTELRSIDRDIAWLKFENEQAMKRADIERELLQLSDG